MDGKPIRVRRPRDASRHGIVLLPESRKDQGLLMLRPVRENITLDEADYTVGLLVQANFGRSEASKMPQ